MESNQEETTKRQTYRGSDGTFNVVQNKNELISDTPQMLAFENAIKHYKYCITIKYIWTRMLCVVFFFLCGFAKSIAYTNNY